MGLTHNYFEKLERITIGQSTIISLGLMFVHCVLIIFKETTLMKQNNIVSVANIVRKRM